MHTLYLSFLLHRQNFWRIKFTPAKKNYTRILVAFVTNMRYVYSTCKSQKNIDVFFSIFKNQITTFLFLQSLLPKSSSLFFVHAWSLSICALIESTRAFTFEFELRLTLVLWHFYWMHYFICLSFIINSSHIVSSSEIVSPTLWSFIDLELSKISPLKSDRQLSGPSVQRTPLLKLPFLSTLSPPVHRSSPPVPRIVHLLIPRS